MTATQRRPRTSARKTAPKPSRPISELLLEIAYHMHTTRVIARPAPTGSR